MNELALCVKATVLLAVAMAVCFLLRRNSAAARHFVWLSAILSVLVILPVLSATLPPWGAGWVRLAPPAQLTASLPSRAAAASAHTTGLPPRANIADVVRLPKRTSVVPGQAPAARVLMPYAAREESASFQPTLDWPLFAVAVWLPGVLALLSQLAIGTILVRRFRRQGRPVCESTALLAQSLSAQMGLHQKITLLQASAACSIPAPVTFGLVHPTILLPAQSAEWTEDCLRAALLHEMAHVKRGDWLALMGANLACAVYWFHPLVWVAARGLWRESEHASDDCVLQAGVKPSEYAQQLVDVVRSMPRNRALALAMADPREVPERVKAVLDPRRSRGALSPRRCLGAILLLCLILVPLAALRLNARPAATSRVFGNSMTYETGTPLSDNAPPGYRQTRLGRGTLAFVALSNVVSSQTPGARFRIVAQPDANGNGGYRFLDLQTGRSFREADQIDKDAAAILSQGTSKRSGAFPHYVPSALQHEVAHPLYGVYLTNSQLHQLKQLDHEADEWNALMSGASIVIDDGDVDGVQADVDNGGQVMLKLTLTSSGLQEMSGFTSTHIGQVAAVFVDHRLQSAPTLRGPITDGRMELGWPGLTMPQARYFAALISKPWYSIRIPGATRGGPSLFQAGGHVTIASDERAKLPNGYTVSIDAVTQAVLEGPSQGSPEWTWNVYGQTWWKPDGTPLDHAGLDRAVSEPGAESLLDTAEGRRGWDALANGRVAPYTIPYSVKAPRSAKLNSFNFAYEVQAATDYSGNPCIWRQTGAVAGGQISAFLPVGQTTCTIRVSVGNDMVEFRDVMLQARQAAPGDPLTAADRRILDQKDISAADARRMTTKNLVMQTLRLASPVESALYPDSDTALYSAAQSSNSMKELLSRNDFATGFVEAYSSFDANPKTNPRYDYYGGVTAVYCLDAMLVYPPLQSRLAGHEKEILLAMCRKHWELEQINETYPKGQAPYGGLCFSLEPAQQLARRVFPNALINSPSLPGGLELAIKQLQQLCSR